jgi:diguanylate cyclase (GGDEF)-like protein
VGAVELFRDCSEKISAMRKIEDLEELALHCPLTRVANRAYSQQMLENTFNEFLRYAWPFGVIFIDIDHFKSVNDTHGHETGDIVLKAVASTIMNALRSFDFVGRWGGEEFLVITPNVDRQALAEVSERLRVLVANSYVLAKDRRISVTVSIGATVACPVDTPKSLVERADRLMYRSKAEGRNKVTLDA